MGEAAHGAFANLILQQRNYWTKLFEIDTLLNNLANVLQHFLMVLDRYACWLLLHKVMVVEYAKELH